MKAVYHNKSESGGIYRILNIDNGRVYIGSTYCFRKRFKSHRNALVTNTHKNKFLQNDFNKCGENSFLFEVIEEIISKEINTKKLIREQFFIDQHYDNQKQCYNLRPDACDSRSGTRNIKEINRETDKRCKTPSPEILEKRSKGIKETKSTEEQKEKAKQNCLNGLWKNHSANVTLVNQETGEEVLVTGSLRDFALLRGLSYKSLHQLVKGKIKTSGGWHLKNKPPVYVSQKGQKRNPLSEEHKKKIASHSNRKYQHVKLISPEGEIVDCPTNIKQFCKDNNLHYKYFLDVLNGKYRSCKKWTISEIG